MAAPSLFHSRTDLRKLRRFAASARYPGNVKIHFGFTVAGDRSAIDTARRVVQLLEELGHEVLTRHLVSDNAWEADRSISPRDVFRRDMAWLDQCELFIAEVSGSSFGLGFETGYPLGSTNKKVVLLYRGELEKRVSLMDSLHLALHGERRFICLLQHSHKIAASACICPCAPRHPSTGGLQDPRLSDHLYRCRSLWCSFRSTELRIGGPEDRRSEVPPARNPDPPANPSSRSAELSRSVNNHPP